MNRHVRTRAHNKAAKTDDESLVKALESYHREKLTNNQKISERLKREHGITMRLVSTYFIPSTAIENRLSASTVKRRRKELCLQGSGSQTQSMDVNEARQLIINAMDVDCARRTGVKGTQHRIAFDTGTHLTRYLWCLMGDLLLTHGLQGFCVICDA